MALLPPPFIRVGSIGQVEIGYDLEFVSSTGLPSSGIFSAAATVEFGFPTPPASILIGYSAVNNTVTCTFNAFGAHLAAGVNGMTVTLPIPRATPFGFGQGQCGGTVSTNNGSTGVITSDGGTPNQCSVLFPTAIAGATTLIGSFQYSLA